jgi:hypothetical protein
VDASPRLGDIHELVSAGDTGHTTIALGDVDRALRVLVVLYDTKNATTLFLSDVPFPMLVPSLSW